MPNIKQAMGCKCCGVCHCFKYQKGVFRLNLHFLMKQISNNGVIADAPRGMRFLIRRTAGVIVEGDLPLPIADSPFWISNQFPQFPNPLRVGLYIPHPDALTSTKRPRIVFWENETHSPTNVTDYEELGSHTGLLYECNNNIWELIEGEALKWPLDLSSPNLRRIGNEIEGVTGLGFVAQRVPLEFQCVPSVRPSTMTISFSNWVEEPIRRSFPTNNFRNWVNTFDRAAFNQFGGIGLPLIGGLPASGSPATGIIQNAIRYYFYNRPITGLNPDASGPAWYHNFVFDGGTILANTPEVGSVHGYPPNHNVHSAGTLLWFPFAYILYPEDLQGEVTIQIFIAEYVLESVATSGTIPYIPLSGNPPFSSFSLPDYGRIYFMNTYRWVANFNGTDIIPLIKGRLLPQSFLADDLFDITGTLDQGGAQTVDHIYLKNTGNALGDATMGDITIAVN